ncbi:type IV secretion system protein [Tunturiibacter psychrotolerans]|uniref:type IV secretion system protein n=1 Tax=Tunturiibacter psychrotolerans TaxID=3069686 RepID=UPI003D1A6F0E
MMLFSTNLHPSVGVFAFFQGTQLSLFERFLTQAVSGINSTSITSGMQNAAYVMLLVGFLWQVYQSAMHGGDVRGLGTNLIKYVVTAIVVMNYSAIFTTVNQGFVNAGNWISNASGGNVFENWMSDLKNQFTQDGTQQMWGLVTGSIAGLVDGVLIIVAYILYPFVVAIFGFFYIFYGSVLYIFGPIVIALMPLGATNRIAKAYVENVFIWNAWPILYGGFGALLTAVQMGQVGQMLNQNDFLGGLGNLEGSFLIGIASIIFSLAIAIIPFIAKRIVSGDVGSTAAAMVGTAVTALTVGAAAVEGAAAGVAAGGSGATAGTSAGSFAGVSAGSARSAATSASGNQPTPPQQTSRAAAATTSQLTNSISMSGGEPTAEGHADQMRGFLSEAVGTGSSEESSGGVVSSTIQNSSNAGRSPIRDSSRPSVGACATGVAIRGPSAHRYNIGTWSTYHVARLAARSLTGAARGTSVQD